MPTSPTPTALDPVAALYNTLRATPDLPKELRELEDAAWLPAGSVDRMISRARTSERLCMLRTGVDCAVLGMVVRAAVGYRRRLGRRWEADLGSDGAELGVANSGLRSMGGLSDAELEGLLRRVRRYRPPVPPGFESLGEGENAQFAAGVTPSPPAIISAATSATHLKRAQSAELSSADKTAKRSKHFQTRRNLPIYAADTYPQPASSNDQPSSSTGKERESMRNLSESTTIPHPGSAHGPPRGRGSRGGQYLRDAQQAATRRAIQDAIEVGKRDRMARSTDSSAGVARDPLGGQGRIGETAKVGNRPKVRKPRMITLEDDYYQCEKCEKKFADACVCRRHIRRHVEEGI